MSLWKPLGREEKTCTRCKETKYINKNDDICLKCKRREVKE
jgi:hypothetical protein